MPKQLISPILEKTYRAPKIHGICQTGETIDLAVRKGQWLVVFFYPKDLTSGCSLEAADFQRRLKDFAKAEALVVGVSKDTPATHTKFCEKLGLEFDLLSDEEGKLCEAFEVWKEKQMYGRSYMGIERSTFLVDPAGFVVAAWRKVKVPGHVDEVLATLKSLQVRQ